MLYKKCQIIVLIPIFLFHVVTSSAQQRDSHVREYLSPIRIVWQQESQLIQGAEYLLRILKISGFHTIFFQFPC